MNPLYVSTTFLEGDGTSIATALARLSEVAADGVELGSTHRPDPRFLEIVQESSWERILVHNYCPPADIPMVVNIASLDPRIAGESIVHIKRCIDFAVRVGARLYTLHPGFMVEPDRPGSTTANYDFVFSSARYDHQAAWDRMAASLEEILHHAAARGVPVALESAGSMRHPDKLLLQRPEEFAELRRRFGGEIGINLNLSHTVLASRAGRFSATDLIAEIAPLIRAVEVSHCDLVDDQHRALVPDSFVFDYLPCLPDTVPLILELRNVDTVDLKYSLGLLRAEMK
ncbi:MAG: TIM barrel protein [Pseudomonadota bacterium]